MTLSIRRIKWDEIGALQAADDGSNEGVLQAAKVILEASNQVVPRDTGALAGTGTVDFSEDLKQATVSYDTVYAARLHQNPQFHFKQGRGKFLSYAMNSSKPRILKYFGEALKVRFSKKK